MNYIKQLTLLRFLAALLVVTYIESISSISLEPDIIKNDKGYEIRNSVIDMFIDSNSKVSSIDEGPINVSYHISIIINRGFADFNLYNLRAIYNFNKWDFKTIYRDVKNSIKHEPDRTINKDAYVLKEEFFNLLKDGTFKIDIFDLYYETEISNLITLCSESIISYLNNINDVNFKDSLKNNPGHFDRANYIVSVFMNLGLRYIQHQFRTSNKIDHISFVNFTKAINIELNKYNNIQLSNLIDIFFSHEYLRGKNVNQLNNSNTITLLNLYEHPEFQEILTTNNFTPLIQCIFGDDIYNTYYSQRYNIREKPLKGYNFSYQMIFYHFIGFIKEDLINKPLIH